MFGHILPIFRECSLPASKENLGPKETTKEIVFNEHITKEREEKLTNLHRQLKEIKNYYNAIQF